MIKVYALQDNVITSSTVKDIKEVSTKDAKQWVDIEGESDEVIRKVLEHFGCHRLAIQDTLRKKHPPKLENFNDSLFMLYRGISTISKDFAVSYVQMAFFITETTIITVHDEKSFGIESTMKEPELSEWITTPALVWLKILKASAKKYLEEIAKLDDTLTKLEEGIAESGNDDDLTRLVMYKTRLRRFRRTANYHEEIVDDLGKLNHQHLLFKDSTHIIQDTYDKFERIYSLSSMYYDLCGDLIDGYLSLTSHHLNKTMQLLTVITAIFIPLGLLAGIYGMNFDNMPELHHPYGYFILLGFMGTIAAVLLYLFKKYKWLE